MHFYILYIYLYIEIIYYGFDGYYILVNTKLRVGLGRGLQIS